MWRASAFELRHPVWIYQLLLVASVLTYLVDPQDIVWRYTKNAPNARLLEHLCFATAAVALAAGAGLCTWATARELSGRTDSGSAAGAGEIFRAIGIGSLLPLAAFLILVCGEAICVVRRHNARASGLAGDRQEEKATQPSAWWQAFRVHIGAWLAFLSMAVFSAMLVDRVAEVLFATTLLVSLLVHWDSHRTRNIA